MVDFKKHNADVAAIKKLLIKDWRAHAKLWSPSASDRWLNCSGSVLANASLPSDPGNKSSYEGTGAHAVLEACITFQRPPSMMVGYKAGEKTNPVDVTAHMAESVDYALTYIEEVKNECLDPVVYYEQEVSMVETGDAGHLDVAVYDTIEKVLHVIDYKNGRHQVDAEENSQMLLYAMGMIQKLMLTYHNAKVVLHIIQPNAVVKDSRWAVPTKYLAAFSKRVEAAVALGGKPGAPFVAGDHCSYCPSAARCPALGKKAAESARQDFQAFIAKPVVVTSNPKRLSNAELVAAYGNLGILSTWAQAVTAAIYAGLAHDGDAFPGLKLVAGTSPRKWADEEKTKVALAKFGVKPDEYAPRKLVGIGEGETLLKKVLPGKDHKDRRDAVMKDLTIKPAGKPSIVSVEDPRPALANSALVDFADLINKESPE